MLSKYVLEFVRQHIPSKRPTAHIDNHPISARIHTIHHEERCQTYLVRLIVVFLIISRLPVAHHRRHAWERIRVSGIRVAGMCVSHVSSRALWKAKTATGDSRVKEDAESNKVV